MAQAASARVEAAHATYVDRFVRTLPEGYDTVIDEEGSNISVGEKQLITIARAFLARPDLLILDDWCPEKLNDEQRRDLLEVEVGVVQARQGEGDDELLVGHGPPPRARA